MMSENGLHDVFHEMNDVEEGKRDPTCEHGSKCTDVALGSEGALKIAQGMELTDFNELIDIDHRGCVIDLNFE